MTNEEFQKIVLEKLGTLENGQNDLNEKFGILETKYESLEEGQRVKQEIWYFG